VLLQTFPNLLTPLAQGASQPAQPSHAELHGRVASVLVTCRQHDERSRGWRKVFIAEESGAQGPLDSFHVCDGRMMAVCLFVYCY
jgi:hypothetical protein